MYIPEDARVDDVDDEGHEDADKPDEKVTPLDADPHNLIIGYEKPIVKPGIPPKEREEKGPVKAVQVDPDFVTNYFQEK